MKDPLVSLISFNEDNAEYSTGSFVQDEIELNLHLVLNLARTLRKEGMVPASIRPNLSSAASRRTSEIRTSRGEQSTPHLREHPESLRGPSLTSLRQVLGPSDVPSRTNSRVNDDSDPAENRASNEAVSEAGPSQGPAVPRRRTPSIRSEDDFIGVRSSKEALRIVMSPNQHMVQGKIKYKDDPQLSVAALVEPEQDFNFITRFRASKLGLLDYVHPHEDDNEDSWIVTPSKRKIRPHGTISLRWYISQSKSISLHFIVLEYWRNREIVLGAPFVEKERYYRERGSERNNSSQSQG